MKSFKIIFSLFLSSLLAVTAFARSGLYGGGFFTLGPATPVALHFIPAAPQISSSSLAGAQVATLQITMSDGSIYNGAVPVFCSSGCGNNFGNGGSLFALNGPASPKITVNQNLSVVNNGSYNSTVKVTQNGVSVFADITVAVTSLEVVFDNGNQPWNLLNQLNAVNYNAGGPSVGFSHTNITTNCTAGQAYRTDFVNFNSIVDSGATLDLGCIVLNNWFDYFGTGAVNSYVLNTRYGNGASSASVWTLFRDPTSSSDGTSIATITLNPTGGYQVFQTVPSTSFSITDTGTHNYRLKCTSADNLGFCGDLVFVQAVQSNTITPDFGQPFTGTVPTEASNAGFNHLVANFDFSNSFYATQSNWLDTGTSGSQWWHSGAPGAPEFVPLNIFQGSDPNTGNTVMIFTWLSSYVGGQGANSQSNQQNIQTVTNNGVAPNSGIKVGNFYVESEVRYDPAWGGQAYLTGGANEGPWTWSDNVSAGTPGLEMDTIETSLADGSANGNMDNHAHPVANGIHWTNYNSQNANLPPGYTITAYHTYGGMLTSDGATSGYGCLWVDHLLQQGCESLNFSGGNFTARNWFVMTNGPKGNNGVSTQGANPYRMFVKRVSIWSCANWQLGGAAGMCNGTLLSNAGGLIYWH